VQEVDVSISIQVITLDIIKQIKERYIESGTRASTFPPELVKERV